jgi:sec-independent protein translocase protein TatC
MNEPSKDDELFGRSTMTFGEHLEELRTCLFKAVAGLAVGFIIGLCFGNYVVQFIQRPLSRALTSFYQKESIDRVEAETQKLAKAGGDRIWTKKQIEDRVNEKGLLAEEVYIDPASMVPELKRVFPEQLHDLKVPPQAKVAESENKVAESENKVAAESKQPESAASDAMAPKAQDAKDDKNGVEAGSESVNAVRPENFENMIRVFLWRPSSDDPRMRIKSLNAQEPFAVYVKASLLLGTLISSPWIFIQIWSFIAAGLYRHERHYVQTYLPFSIFLFLAGAAVAFFLVFEPVLGFLFSFNRMTGIAPEPRINEWLSFVLLLPVGFGLGFQLPLVMLFFERIGVFSIESYLKQWRIAVLVIAVLAALVTPPDPTSMIILAGSLTFLYFGGILLCKVMPRRQRPSTDLIIPS